MSDTVFEIVEKRNKLLHKKAVWVHLRSLLEEFIDKDAKKADKVITALVGGEVGVPQEQLREDLAELNAKLSEIDESITQLDTMEVHSGPKPKATRKKAPRKAAPKKAQAGKRKRPVVK